MFSLYLAVGRGFEPLLLVPISFGMLLVNIYPDIMISIEESSKRTDGTLYYFYKLDEWAILPSSIFLGVGAMTDFGPLIANPKSFPVGEQRHSLVFLLLILEQWRWAFRQAAAAISIIGGADGPYPLSSLPVNWDRQQSYGTDRSSRLFLYVPGADHPAADHEASDHRKREERSRWNSFRPVSKLEKILFPIIVTIVVCLILPTTAPLVGMLMLGNLFRESRCCKAAGRDRIQRPDVYCYPAGYFRWATTSAEAFLKLGYHERSLSWV